MVRALVAYGAALIMIGFFYFSTVFPFMLELGDPTGSAEEVEAYAFSMFLVFSAGLLLVQFVVLPPIVAVRRREEGGGGGGGGEEQEQEGGEETDGSEDKKRSLAKGHEEEEYENATFCFEDKEFMPPWHVLSSVLKTLA